MVDETKKTSQSKTQEAIKTDGAKSDDAKSKTAKKDGETLEKPKNIMGKTLYKIKECFSKKPVVAVIRIDGVIGASAPMKQKITASSIVPAIKKAGDFSHQKALAVVINSPGGSPVQSRLIYNQIKRVAKEKEIEVLVFAEDVMASGGYLIALSGDEIYADECSIVGSIGVISAGFGFVGAIDKLGVERRVYTSGKSKSTLDPFKKEVASDVKHLQSIQKEVHEVFIDMVKQSRQGKIDDKINKIFDGSFWSGAQAKELGLVDNVGDMNDVLKEKYGDKVKIKEVEIGKKGFAKLFGMSEKLGALFSLNANNKASFSDDILSTLEERSIWSRYGF